MTQHTPGPWTVHTNFATATYTVFDADGNYGETDGDTLTANAALIAAAPDLLAAARLALDYLETLAYQPSIHPSTKAQDALHDAIFAAQGVPT